MKIVISDTGPLLHLEESDNLKLLTYIGDIFIPPMVALEWERLSPNWQSRWPNVATVIKLEEKVEQTALRLIIQERIDPGEAEAIALTDQIGSDTLLTDDAEARKLAKELGLNVHGSFGVIIEAARVGKLTQEEAAAAVSRLEQSSLRLRLSPRVPKRARVALYKIFNKQ